MDKKPCSICDARLAKYYEPLNIWLCRKHQIDYDEANKWLDNWATKHGFI